jgi:hypothetical protein
MAQWTASNCTARPVASTPRYTAPISQRPPNSGPLRADTTAGWPTLLPGHVEQRVLGAGDFFRD